MWTEAKGLCATAGALLLGACATVDDGSRSLRHIEQGDLAMIEVREGRVPTSGLKLPDVLFATNEATFEPGSRALLTQLAAALENNEQQTVQIEGHADSSGDGDYNLVLSQQRAEAVRNYLIERGVPGERIDMSARGETDPAASNGSDAGRQQNRRVELVVRNTPPPGRD